MVKPVYWHGIPDETMASFISAAVVVLDENGRVVQTFIGPQTEIVPTKALSAVAASANE